jgi:aminoglycoside 6'-N-acetyltransferase I
MPKSFTVRPAVESDSAAWLEMRNALWADHENKYHVNEIRDYFAGKLKEPIATLVACDAAGNVVGFVELNIRNYAEDCDTDRVAYLEGWYVAPEARRKGVGAALIRASEDWGRAQGCTEFGSDALIDNVVSEKAHKALGFTETVQIRCFRKDL